MTTVSVTSSGTVTVCGVNVTTVIQETERKPARVSQCRTEKELSSCSEYHESTCLMVLELHALYLHRDVLISENLKSVFERKIPKGLQGKQPTFKLFTPCPYSS